MTAPTWTDSCAPDPEPTPDDDGPWCYYPDLDGQGADYKRLTTMTTVTLRGDHL